ncbi:MAG: hypothetical protein ACREK9_14605 [Candidatus Rokuibacteriota bacterium]
MKRSRWLAVTALWGLAGCAQDRIDGQWMIGGTLLEWLGLFLVAVTLYSALAGLVALMTRRAPRTRGSFDLVSGKVRPLTKHARHRRRRRPARRPRIEHRSPD